MDSAHIIERTSRPVALHRLLTGLLAIFCILHLAFAPAANAAGPADAAADSTPIRDKWALIVGISKFAMPSLNLRFAAKDAADFKEFLITKCHFAPDHIKLMTNEQCTKERIMDVLGDSWLPRVALPDDLVVVFISSHGSPADMDVRGSNFIVTYDTNPDHLYATGLSLMEIAVSLKDRVHTGRSILILDACHSAADNDTGKGLNRVLNFDVNQVAAGSGSIVLSSSEKSQRSWESKNYQNGIFTHTLMEALQSKGESTKLGDAFAYLKDNVQAQTAAERGMIQTPCMAKGMWKGPDLVLGAKPASPRKALIDPNTVGLGPTAMLPKTTTPTGELPVPAAVQPAPQTGQIPPPNLMGKQPPKIAANMTSGTTVAPRRFGTAPSIEGVWIGGPPLNLRYIFQQNGRKCPWQVPDYGTTGNSTISEDGTTMASSWSGPLSVGSNNATLTVNENNVVTLITADDGQMLHREGGGGMTSPNSVNMQQMPQTTTTQNYTGGFPDVSGVWLSTSGSTYQVTQSGNKFAWTSATDGEVGMGMIMPDRMHATCAWKGRTSGSCDLYIQSDSTGRALKMLSTSGSGMIRVPGQ